MGLVKMMMKSLRYALVSIVLFIVVFQGILLWRFQRNHGTHPIRAIPGSSALTFTYDIRGGNYSYGNRRPVHRPHNVNTSHSTSIEGHSDLVAPRPDESGYKEPRVEAPPGVNHGMSNGTKNQTSSQKSTPGPGLERWGSPASDACGNVTYTTYQTGTYCLKEDVTMYAMKAKAGRWPCLLDGSKVIPPNGAMCACNDGWYGESCSIPVVVKHSNYPEEYGLAISKVPRRIIYAFAFSHEFDMLEARVYEYGNIVDLYIILESNYTAFGDQKKRLLKDHLDSGFLRGFQHKILYVSLDYFPQAAKDDGWIIDALLRNHISEALQSVTNVREDDVFVLSDADEIPSKEALLFLKINYGYTQPIGFNFHHSVFGFYWENPDGLSHANGACLIGMLKHVFDWQPYLVRSAPSNLAAMPEKTDHYKYKHKGRVRAWDFGSQDFPAGWHCSWCFDPEGIRQKMLAAHSSDRPRWGNFPQKSDLKYIRLAVERGLWFDDKLKFVYRYSGAPNYAPSYLMAHPERFTHILKLPEET